MTPHPFNKDLTMDYEKKYNEALDFKTKLAEYFKNNSPKDGQYVISSESILQMAKEELIKRGELKEPKPNIELIQRSWYMEGYHDRDFFMEPKWILKTGEGGPKYEPNPRYGKSLILGPEPCCCSVNVESEYDKGRRDGHKAGLKDAEKDLALTWEDIRTITKILEEVTEEVIPVEFYNGDAIGCFKEVLRRFKEAKNDGNGTVHP